MRRFSILMTSMATLSVVVSGCAGKSSSGNQSASRVKYASGATFTLALRDDLGSFDPYHSNLIKGYSKLAYDSLVHLRSQGDFVSGLAEKWTADAHSASFTLRNDVTCSDGTPLTPRQVAAALTYLGDPKNGSSLYGSQIPSVPYKVAVDDSTRTLTITMSHPYGFILRTIGTAPIVCAKGLKDPKPLAKTSDGTGPFILEKVVPGQSYTFTVRKGYVWGPGGASTSAPGTPAKIVLRVVSSESTAANLLLSGELNWAQITGDDRQRLDAQGLARKELPSAGAWLWLNHREGRPTADKRVRQALIHALDLAEIIRVSTGGTGSASTGLTTLTPRPCPRDTVAGLLPKYDVAAAEALLDQEGWAKGSDGTRRKDGKPLALDLHYVPSMSSFDKPTAELLAKRWGAVGVRVKLIADAVPTMSQVLFQTGSYDIYLQGLGNSLPSAYVKYISGPVPPKGINLAGIENKDYDTLTAKAATMTAPQACAYWEKAEQALWRDVDMAPLSSRPLAYYLKNAQAQLNGIDFPIPTSIRVTD